MICWIAVNKLLYDQLAAGCGDGSERSNEHSRFRMTIGWQLIRGWCKLGTDTRPFFAVREIAWKQNQKKKRNSWLRHICVRKLFRRMLALFPRCRSSLKEEKKKREYSSIHRLMHINQNECKPLRIMWGYSSAMISRLSMTSANNNRPTKILIPFINIEHTEHAPSVRRVN